MHPYIEKLISVKGEPTKQMIDLVLFLTYFSISLYIGGFSYSMSYYSQFNIDASFLLNHQQFIILFITEVIWERLLIIFMSIIFLLIFIFLYYSARNVWKPWFGFLILTLIFCSTFVICIWVGDNQGSVDGKNDKLKRSTALPTVKVLLESDAPKYSDGDYCLLLQTNDDVYIYKPVELESSITETIIISKSNIKNLEITVK